MSTNVRPARLRVLQCITRLGLGGAERVALSLVRELSPHVDFAVFTVHGCSSDAAGAAMRSELRARQIPWFTGTVVPMKTGGMVPGAYALAAAMRAFHPDIVHFHSETPEACGAMRVQLGLRPRECATVRTIHNSVFWRYWPRIGRWCDRQLANAHVGCVSHDARAEFLRYRADSGVPPPSANPVVIPNGVALLPLAPRSGPGNAGERRVLFAGRFEAQKGTDVLRRALPLIRLPPNTSAQLTLVGHGADEPALRRLVTSPPNGWTIYIQPAVASLETIFPRFDLVVMPSRFEGLGLVAVEATLCGLPVIATRAPGLREALPPRHPWLAVPGDESSLAAAMEDALGNPSHWGPAVIEAQSFARARFSPDAMRSGYLGLYQCAAGRPA